MSYQTKNYRKFISTAATATLVASAFAPVASADSSKFQDVNKNYKEAVDFVVSKGAKGVTDTKFGVHENIKRVDAAVLLVNVLELDIETAPASGFTDVPKRAIKEVNALKKAGITTGKSTTKFDPDAQITRGELAVWIQRGFEFKASEEKLKFTDVAKQYQEAVSALVANGVTKGKTDTKFGTNEKAKRGDYAIFLHRASQAEPPIEDAEAKIESVEGINAKQLVVKFSTPLADDVTTKQLQDAFSLEGKKLQDGVIPVISEDRKEVTYTLDSAEANNASVVVQPLNTSKKDENGQTLKTEKYLALYTFDDKEAPKVKDTTYTYNQNGTANAKVTFNEGISSAGTVSVNGVEKTITTEGNSFIIPDLEVGKTYKIDIVGALDTATPPNRVNQLSMDITVPAETADTTAPTATHEVDGNKLTLTFDEEVTPGSVKIGETAVASKDITTTDNKTFIINVQKANEGAFFEANGNFFTSEVVVTDFKDKSAKANPMAEKKFSDTFNADKSAADLTGGSATADGKIVLEFNEDVSDTVTGSLNIKSIDGVTQEGKTLNIASSKHQEVDGKAVPNKLELTLDGASQLEVGKNYVVELQKDAIVDLYDNKNTNPITTSVVRPSIEGDKPGPVINTEISAANNIINIAFSNTEGMSDEATKPSNYSLGGKPLPENTKIQFINNKNNVRITLPEGLITANGDYTLKASNLTDLKGNTLTEKEETATIKLKENIPPVAKTLTTPGSKSAKVVFSESVQFTDGNANDILDGILVKVNGNTVSTTNTVGSGDLNIAFKQDIKSSDQVTVEFKGSELFDGNGNQLKDGSIKK